MQCPHTKRQLRSSLSIIYTQCRARTKFSEEPYAVGYRLTLSVQNRSVSDQPRYLVTNQ